MRRRSIFSLKVLRVSKVWVKSGVHLTVRSAVLIKSGVRFGVRSKIFVKSGVHFGVRSKVLVRGLACQLSLPQGCTLRLRKGFSWFLPQPWSSAGWLLLMVGSFIGRLLGPPGDALKVEVKATALLQSRLFGPIPGVLPGFLSCHIFCFLAGVSWIHSASE